MIHNVFHISQLKLKLGQNQHVQHLQPALTKEFELQVEPKAVLGIRWNSDIGANEWLVKWKGLHDSEATSESIYSLNQQCPSFRSPKVSFAVDGIVRPPIIHTYKRRGRKGNNQGAA